ncbi:MAG: hypothetical protein Q7J45_02250 [bacterium]|nr:hypothetical protein [bacterium]
MLQRPEDDTGSLERAREHLYKPGVVMHDMRAPMSAFHKDAVPHEWREEEAPKPRPRVTGRHVRFAGIFFAAAFFFFLLSLGGVSYFFFYGGNSVSVEQITVDIQGPTMIAGGDTVPLSLAITNKNPTAIENAMLEITFPSGTRNATDVLNAYPRYVENLGTLQSGATVMRSVKAVMFGGAGQNLSLPVSLTYTTGGSDAVFVKKSSYALTISSTPLSISVDTAAETVSGKPLILTVSVRSNATVPLSDVVLVGAFPFGFSVDSSSVSMSNSSFALGTLQPGVLKTVKITGTLMGQDKEKRVFRFTVGTAKSAQDQALAVSYMSQDANVTITTPFIDTNIAVNGNTVENPIVSPGSRQDVTVSYKNTLPTNVTNATVTVTISGPAVDYASITSQDGFYRSADHSVVFSQDTDPDLGMLAPDAVGSGSFSFSTLPVEGLGPAPTITFSISVAGSRDGQENVPEQVSSTILKTVKVSTVAALTAYSLHNFGSISNSGPIPPRANQVTTYSVVWNVQNKGNAIAGGSVTSKLPNYVTYSGATAGSGSFTYDSKTHVVTWSTGDLTQSATAQGMFKVSITPSTSQKGSSPALTGSMSFSGYDRFAGVSVSATADPVTTETTQEPGYTAASAIVQ